MSRQPSPTYDLLLVQEAVRRGDVQATQVALDGAAALGLDFDDITACVLALDDSDFYKTMEARKMRGLMQDVYRPTYDGISIYLKLQMRSGAVVISFKQR